MNCIPIIHCFDHNYVLQAGVCFHSLLTHANPQRTYALHVVGTGLTEDDRADLHAIVGRFPNATLAFTEAPALDLPDFHGGNFAKDLFYKLKTPELFPQYDIAIISDVDVVYADDIALAFDALNDPHAYLAGPLDVSYAAWRGEGILRDLGAPKALRRYHRQFTGDERAQLRIGAGLMTFNLRKMREDRLSEQCFAFARANFARLILPEQDILNLVCQGRTCDYPPRLMAIAGYEEHYRQMSPEARQANPAWDAMFAHPVQIHYATGIKPWKYPASPMADLWFDALLASGLFPRWRAWIDHTLHHDERLRKRRRLFACACPLGSRRRLVLELFKDTLLR